MNARRAHLVINAILFQLSWLVCVQGKSGWAFAITVLVMTLHWRIVMISACECLLWLAALALGFVVDSLFIVSGLLQLPEAGFTQPLWLACLWVLFASTLLHSAAFLQRNLLLAAIAGLVGGPLAYYTGTQFGAASLGSDFFETLSPLYEKWMVLLLLGLCWSVVMPLLVLLARRLSGDGANTFA